MKNKNQRKNKPRKLSEEIKVKSNMDLKIDSSDYLHTPAQWAMNLPFYLESCGHFYACDEYFTEREKLKSYLLIYTKSGMGKIFYENKEITATENTVLLIDCLKYQYYKTESKACWDFKWIHLNGIAMGYYYKLINEDNIQLINIGSNPEIDEIFTKIQLTAEKRSSNADLKFSEYLTSLLTEIILSKKRNYREHKYINHKSEILDAVETIKKNYSSKISIADLAEQSHLSKYYFSRIFKEFTGQGPYEFLIFCRINESKNLLLGTENSVAEISLKCGFDDTSNFIRYFKKFTGSTPGVFRKVKAFGG